VWGTVENLASVAHAPCVPCRDSRDTRGNTMTAGIEMAARGHDDRLETCPQLSAPLVTDLTIHPNSQ